jgi:importin subunit beta-1
MVAFLSSLREGLLTAYTGILQGLSGSPGAATWLPFLPPMMKFLERASLDTGNNVKQCLAGTLGDLTTVYGTQAREQLTLPFVSTFLESCQDSEVDEIRQLGRWANQKLHSALQDV